MSCEELEMELNDRFPFGKYKGMTAERVIQEDPAYIKWAIDNHVILLSNEAYAIYERNAE